MDTTRRQLLVLGTGFGSFNVIKTASSAFDITVVSPRNHFLFTPLLPSTTVGTIEFRSIIEPIRHAHRLMQYYWASAEALDPERRVVRCKAVENGEEFELRYDILAIAVGAVSTTFNVPGVKEHAHFLKELHDARELRQRIIRNFEHANIPGISPEDRRRLLSFVVCGGGPTGVEFAAELHDFLKEDLAHTYPPLVPQATITVVEAGKELLGAFDHRLRQYAMDFFRRGGITVHTTSMVTSVEPCCVHLSDGSMLPYGLLLWSTGNGPTDFIQAVPLPKDAKSRILVDPFLAVKGFDGIYALGDCAVVEGSPMPATAQVAQQQGRYLGKALVRGNRGKIVRPFRYRPLGMLAYVGDSRALADLEAYKGRGWATWLFWRSAYFTRIVSVKNKVLVLFDWFKTRIFGRDVSQF